MNSDDKTGRILPTLVREDDSFNYTTDSKGVRAASKEVRGYCGLNVMRESLCTITEKLVRERVACTPTTQQTLSLLLVPR